MFRSILDVETLVAAHREDLLPHVRAPAATGPQLAPGPLARTRRAAGLLLIALGERLAGGSDTLPLPGPLTLGAAGGRQR